MMMTDTADILRAAGLIVEEVAGWQDRGHGGVDFQVSVDHHTAGNPNGRAPSLATCIYGVPSVPGPLCNVLQTREVNGPDHFVVIAAGTSYNAGVGSWAGYAGNHMTFGLEVEHTGVELYPDERREYTWRFNAAMLNAYGLSSDRVCQHFEWSTAGKIDIAQGVDPDYWRMKIAEYQKQPSPILLGGLASPEEDSVIYRHAGNPALGLPDEFGLWQGPGKIDSFSNLADAIRYAELADPKDPSKGTKIQIRTVNDGAWWNLNVMSNRAMGIGV